MINEGVALHINITYRLLLVSGRQDTSYYSMARYRAR